MSDSAFVLRISVGDRGGTAGRSCTAGTGRFPGPEGFFLTFPSSGRAPGGATAYNIVGATAAGGVRETAAGSDARESRDALNLPADCGPLL